MTFAAGDVVTLKSGGLPMTVVEVEDDEAVCIWTGDEGDLFRETIPTVALQAAQHLDFDEDDEDREEAEDEGEASADKTVSAA